MSTTSPELPEFNPRTADAMVASSERIGGLPCYLGIRIDSLTPGVLVASMPVREELLTIMGAIHGEPPGAGFRWTVETGECD